MIRRLSVQSSARAIAAGLTLALLAGGLAACGRSAEVVTVLGPWLDAEAAQFKAVLDGAGVRYRYQGTRTPGEALRAAEGTPEAPDIAILPALDDLATFAQRGKARDLRPVLGSELDNYDPFWLASPISAFGSESVYAIPVKANLKSLTWRNTEVTRDPPASWDEALRSTWCLGMADPPNTAWPGTDWIEDILLHQEGGRATYSDLVAGEVSWTAPAVQRAWQTFGSLVTSPQAGLPVLVTQYSEAGQGLIDATPTGGRPASCELDHQPSFILNSYRDIRSGPEWFDFSRYRTQDTNENWSVVSADFAALFGDSADASTLIRHIASVEGQSAWPADKGAFSANEKVPVPDRTSTVGRISEIVAGGTDTKFCLDASDLMPTQLREAFYTGVRDYLVHLGDRAYLSKILKRLDEVQKKSSRAVQRDACPPGQ